MQIEIAEPGRMTQTGSSLRRLIQNNNTPILDLLVRESIQNSLDARKKNTKYVEVDFLTGKFNSECLSIELDKLDKPLRSRYGNKECDYLAIRDFNTVGLTGEMDYKKIKNNKYGNLLKLVYEICKPQEAEGSGGSWGIGKTVYFRIGIGLVIYYSRIQNEEGDYESRLAASLVEDETEPGSMIPVYNGMSKRGIAWWGTAVGENETQPVTDEDYISKFLRIFGIDEYSGDETGTTIIIPYIDSKALLNNNQIEYLNDQNQPVVPFWGNSIEEYLLIAVQRWYAPRLNNIHYRQGAYLRVKINNAGIGLDDMEPVFKIIQSLYNRACYVEEDDILSEVSEKGVEGIKIRKYLEDPVIGVVSYAKVSRDLLKMTAPNNKPEPFIYFNLEKRDSDVNRPVLCFARKPAMVVAYENIGSWVSNIPSSREGEYILGIFVLNSYNWLKSAPSSMSLEEYVRKSEMADHTSWNDWSDGNYNPRLISKIQVNVNKIIGREFSQVQEIKHPKVNSGLGKMFGDLFLPPEGFGLGAGVNHNSNKGQRSSAKRKFKFEIDDTKIKYNASQMVIPIQLDSSTRKKIKKTGFTMLVDSESKKIDINEWEERMGLNPPFTIQKFEVHEIVVDGEQVDCMQYIDSDESISIGPLRFEGRVSKKRTGYGLSISSDTPHYIKMKIEVYLKIISKNVKPSFSVEKEDENNE